MTKIYGSPILRVVAGLFSIISLFLVLVAVSISAQKLFSSMGFQSQWFFSSLWALVIVYTVTGGLTAVVKTDVIQVLFIMLALVLALAGVLLHDGGFIAAPPPQNNDVPFSEWVLMPFLFVFSGQDMGQRCAAAKSPHTVTQATYVSALLLLLFSAIPVYLGIRAGVADTAMTPAGTAILDLTLSLSGPVVAAIFAAGIFMAIISTADSLLCAISLNIAMDVLPLGTEKPISLRTARVVTLGVGASALACSLLWNTGIIELMVMSYKVMIFALFVPIFLGALLKWKPRAQSAVVSIILGTVIGFFTQGLVQDLLALAFLFGIFLLNEWRVRRIRAAS